MLKSLDVDASTNGDAEKSSQGVVRERAIKVHDLTS